MTLSVGTPPLELSITISVGFRPYNIAYCRVYGLSLAGLFEKCLRTPLCGWSGEGLQGYLAHVKPSPL
jgi:hypothetical protein